MLWALLLAQSIVALQQGVQSGTKQFSTQAVSHVTSPRHFTTQADVSVMYYKYSPTLEQTQAFDVSMVSFELKGDGRNVCMMVSSRELPITPQQNLSACHGVDLRVSVPATSIEFCAPSPDLGSCSYFIGIRIEGAMFPDLKIGVNLQFTEPLYRHLYLSQDAADHLQPVQRFKYTVPPEAVANQVIFSVYISPAFAGSSDTKLLVSSTGFPGANDVKGIYSSTLPNIEVTFTKEQLTAFKTLYKNLTFFLTLFAPTIPESLDYSSSPPFTLKTRVLGVSGRPIAQPTSPPTSWRRGDTSQRTPSPANTMIWVWLARFLGVLALGLLVSFIIRAIKYLCKSRAERQAEALGDLLHQSKQNLEDAWSTSAIQAQADRDVEMQVIRSAAL